MRFETLEQAQAYLDRWDAHWADTRIHGTTKRQVAAMFAEERPALQPLPLEPFRYYRFGVRTVHLDGCVEVEAAYYSAPPGWIGQRVPVQWTDLHVRLLDPKTGQLLREHVRAPRGHHRIADADRPGAHAAATLALLARARHAGAHLHTVCTYIHDHEGAAGVRRILGVLALAKKYGPAAADDAAKAALDLQVPTYRFLRRYLERRPAVPLTLRKSIRSSGSSRSIAISSISRQETRHESRRTRSRAPQAPLSGMADVLDARLRQAQSEQQAPIDLVSALVGDELAAPTGPADRAAHPAGPLPRSRPLARHLRFRFQQEDEPRPDPRPRHRPLHPAARGRPLPRAARHRQESSRAGDRPRGHPAGPSRRSTAKPTPSSRRLADATLDGTRKDFLAELTTVPLLIIDDLGMRKLPHTAAEDLLEIIMRRYERASTLLTSNRPVDDWGKLLGDTAAVTALLDRLLHHAHVLKCGPRSWRTKVHTDLRTEEATQ